MREPLPISSLEHYEYCPRQCALILVDGIWVENRHTVRGQRFHRQADEPGISIRRGAAIATAVEVWSDRYELIGRIDAIESIDDRLRPIEYKAGTRHGRSADVQVCAQALCLEEMLGVEIAEGAIWYGQHRRRVAVQLDDELRAYTKTMIQAVHDVRQSSTLPHANFDERCNQCQLMPMCVPERTGAVTARASDYVGWMFDQSGADR